MEEAVIYHVFVIMPDGELLDVNLTEIPQTGGRIPIKGRSFRIVEAHESVAPEWHYVCSLGG